MTRLPAQSPFALAYQAGETKRKAGRYAEAREDFNAALGHAATAPERAAALLGTGRCYAAWAQAHQYEAWTPPTARIGQQYFEKQRQFEAAQTIFEEILAVPGSEAEQRAQAQYHLATVLYAREQYARAQAELQKITVMEGVTAEWRVKAQLLLGRYTRYGGTGDAVEAYARVLVLPFASPARKAEAHLAIAGILTDRWKRAEAHLELAKIFELPDLPPASRALAHLAAGKLFFLDADYGAARDALTRALAIKEIPGSDRVEAQLYSGLSDYYTAKDYEQAGRELRKVLELPDASYVQIHEATLRLRLGKLSPGEGGRTLTVLFTGSSHTQARNIPQIVEMLAVSAPAGRPRIIASQATFGGHTLQRLWDLGDGPGTPRRRLVQDPWDVLVMECTASPEHARRFAELAGGRGTQPILYETPVSAKLPYPDGFARSRVESVSLAKQLGIRLAPAAHAWRLYLGENPGLAERLALYHPDGVHTAKKGAYLVACTLYATLTGCSPVGLARDMASLAWTDDTGELSDAEAVALQEAAWRAVQETN